LIRTNPVFPECSVGRGRTERFFRDRPARERRETGSNCGNIVRLGLTEHDMRWRTVPAVLIILLITACGGPDNSANGDPAPALAAKPPQPLRLLIIGGTSGIGLETVRLALERGHQVTAMARRPERMTLSHPNLILFKGDVADPYAVDGAVQGRDAIIFTISLGPTQEPVSVFSTGTRNVLDSMERFGVGQLVMITGIGAGDSRGHGSAFYDWFVRPVLLDTVYQDKDHSEELLRESDVDWVIVRPGFLNDKAGTGTYRVIRDLEGVTAGDISRADVAHFLLATVEDEEYWGETVLLTD
jgi:putative NADH-flavin reductase